MSNTIVQDLNTIKTARDNMKTALEGKGQTVTKDIRTYAEAITNIEGGGSGDVKLFETVESMQADSTAQEGDLAVVYREELTGITEESEFNSCIFSTCNCDCRIVSTFCNFNNCFYYIYITRIINSWI